jgi:glycosyltransferase involved in cell wall biosynthesis
VGTVRILHVNPAFGLVGGTESYLLRLVRDLQERGHELHVAAERLVGLEPLAASVPFHPLENISALEVEGREEDSARRLQQIVDDTGVEVIHLHNVLNARIVETAGRLRPTIRSVHDHTLFCPGLNKEYADGGLCARSMGRHCLRRYRGAGCQCLRFPTLAEASHRLDLSRRLLRAHRSVGCFAVASRYMRSELVRVGIRRTRIVVNPLYIELPSDPPAGNTPPTVIAVCRMVHPDKGVAVLLAALALVSVPYRALLVGDGPDLAFLQERARELGLAGDVEFLGAVPHARTLEIIGRATVVAFPSMWNEPFGIVGLEAMARARPVVAFDVGAVREWLRPGVTGCLVARGDVEAFARALSELLASPERASELGRRGPALVGERFAKREHLGVLEQAYARTRATYRARGLLRRLWAWLV